MNDVAQQQRDWVGSPLSRIVAWGIPTAALAVGIFLEPSARTWIWVVSLTWMGIACLANATRCGRRHCYLTGPFFLVMAIAVLLHGLQIIWLGPQGWLWLGLVFVAGGYGLLWILPELVWGKFVRR